MAAMRFKGGRIASFTSSFGAADRSVYTITGTRGTLTMDPAYEYAEGLSYKLKQGDKSRKKKFSKSDQFAPELLYFSDCILTNKKPEPSGQEGLIDVRIIEAMQRSINTGRWVNVQIQQKKRRPTKKLKIVRPAIPREPQFVQVASASQ